MIDYATWQHIGHLHRVDKLTVAQIARAVSLDARTVHRWLDEPRFRARATAARPSKLDPYKGYIVRLLEHHRYSAVQIRQRLREAGYDGGLTIVKDYVRQVRWASRIWSPPWGCTPASTVTPCCSPAPSTPSTPSPPPRPPDSSNATSHASSGQDS